MDDTPRYALHDRIVVHKPSPNTDKIPTDKVGVIVGFAVRFPGTKGIWVVQSDEIRPINATEQAKLNLPLLDSLFRDPEEAIRQGVRQVVQASRASKRRAPVPPAGPEGALAPVDASPAAPAGEPQDR